MATFKGQEGIWRTSETGVHYFIPEGVDPEQAWAEWSKNRHYLQYWEASKPDKYGISSYSRISKKEYNKLIESNGEGKINDYLEDRFNRYDIPEDIEEKMSDSLNNIKSIKNKVDFFNQLRQQMVNRDLYHAGSFQVIRDAFDSEITARYNELIQPVLQKVDSIDIDNSYEHFEQGLKMSKTLRPLFKDRMLENFDKCQNEDCKVILAVMTDVFDLSFTNKEGSKEWSYCNANGTEINILSDHNDTNTLFHEGFHAVFERYNVRESGLKETIKKEMNKSKKIDEITRYFLDNEAADIDYKNYKELEDEISEANTRMNDSYSKAKEDFGQPITIDNSKEFHDFLTKNSDYEKNRDRYVYLSRLQYRIKQEVRTTLFYKYENIADMISAATWNKSEFGSGHTGNYWGQDKWNQANEFFAEMAEMKATGDTNQYELIRKFAPESVKKFEEIFNSIIKNKKEPLKL